MATFEAMQAILARQLTMTVATWSRLVSHGVTDGAPLALDFFFHSPSIDRARELQEFLQRETDYSVSITADKDEWTVYGSTQPTEVSLSVLQQWVDWMVSAGYRFDAVFDGWGAEAG